MRKSITRLIGIAVATAMAWVAVPAAHAQDVTLSTSAANFNTPIGIDFHEPTGQLIMSVNYPTGSPNNLDLVQPGGGRSQFSSLVGLTNELKIATVRAGACQGGFTVGEVFTGNGTPGGIVRLGPNSGDPVLNPWVVLPSGPPGNDLLRGSLFQDRFCAANGDLIVVTGNEQGDPPVNTSNGNVWRVTSAGAATLVATTGTHLEGVTTVPNNPAVYGPMAGRILAGAEDLINSGNTTVYGTPNHGRIYAFNPNPPNDFFTIGAGFGVACVTPYTASQSGCNYATLEIHPEDLDVIRRNAEFFGVNYDTFPNGRMLSAPAVNFDGLCGQILITREFPSSSGGPGNASGLSVLSWDAVAGTPVVDYLTSNMGVQQWEHVTFTSGQDCATTITIEKTPDGGTFSIGGTIEWTILVTNTGPVTALGVTVDDQLPITAGLQWTVFSTSQGSCTISAGQLLQCNLGNLNASPGPGNTATVVVRSASPATAAQCQRLDNTATAVATNAGQVSNPGDQTCTPPGSFTLTKSPKNATYQIGDNISFSMVVTSTGPGTANNVVLNDPLPTLGNLNTWTISADATGLCTIVANTLNCPYGNLANGQVRSVTVATNAAGGANASACTGATLNNTATVMATGLPPQTDTGDYTCQPGSYTLTKNPKNATYNIGDNINFTMVVTSTGPGTANNVVLNDPLPTLGNLNTWIITTNPGGVCTIVANVLNCPFGNLANGQIRTVVVATNTAGGANAAACTGATLNNTATLTGTGLPPKTDTGDYTCQPGSYTLTKNPKNATYNIGDNINFTMVVTSTGPGTANNVVLNDPLPTLGNLNTWIITTNPGGVCTIVANVLNCPFGNLANGQTRTVVVATNAAGGANATACPGGVKLNNTATLTGTGLPPKTDTGDYICTPVTGKPIQIGPSTMEGAIKIDAGDWVNGGYSFKFKSTHVATNFTVTATVSITGACLSPDGKDKLGTTDTIVVPLGTVTYPIPAGGATGWLPTGDANSVLSWQGSVIAPSTLCGGGGNKLDASKGAVFDAVTSQSPNTSSLVDFRFKFRDPAAKGKPNTNCLDTSDPNRDKADVCGASWSSTQQDP